MTLVLLGLTMPWFTHAASSARPSCSLAVTTTLGTSTTTKSGDIYFTKGSVVNIAWDSNNAMRMTDTKGRTIALSGNATTSPSKITEYTYHARTARTHTTCTVTLYPVTGTIKPASLISTSRTPTLAGTATGVKTVRIVAQKVGSERAAYTSGALKVTKGVWRAPFSKKLPTGTYTVSLVGAKNIDQNIIATGTLYVGTKAPTNTDTVTKGGSTLAVASIPLLAGGVARAGTIVPVAYLQMTNIGKDALTLTGLTLSERGSTPTSFITVLTTVDGTGSLKSTTDASKAGKLFTDSKAFVPMSNITFAPGQMRLFTVKAVLAPEAVAALNTNIIMDIASVETNGSVRAALPIRGATWVIR
jgi:hypothetical protein